MTIKLKNNIKNYLHSPGKYEAYGDQLEDFLSECLQSLQSFSV